MRVAYLLYQPLPRPHHNERLPSRTGSLSCCHWYHNSWTCNSNSFGWDCCERSGDGRGDDGADNSGC